MNNTKTTKTSLQSEVEFINQKEKLLRDSVNESLQNYFKKIKGTPVRNVYEMVLTEVERPLFNSVMLYTKGNQSKSAVLLGLSRGTLRKKLKNYDLL